MKDRIFLVFYELKTYMLSILYSGLSGVVYEKAIGRTIDAAITLIVAIASGSLLFILQKTILPVIVKKINEKLK